MLGPFVQKKKRPNEVSGDDKAEGPCEADQKRSVNEDGPYKRLDRLIGLFRLLPDEAMPLLSPFEETNWLTADTGAKPTIEFVPP